MPAAIDERVLARGFVKGLLNDRGISEPQLAAHLGITRQAVSDPMKLVDRCRRCGYVRGHRSNCDGGDYIVSTEGTIAFYDRLEAGIDEITAERGGLAMIVGPTDPAEFQGWLRDQYIPELMAAPENHVRRHRNSKYGRTGDPRGTKQGTRVA